MKRKISLASLSTLMLFLAGFALSAWFPDPTVNTSVCTAPGNQWFPQLISDGSGGAIISWYDRRSGRDYDIYAQRLDASGNACWRGDGAPVCTAVGDQWFPQLVSDGSGGAIITWHDRRGKTDPSDIYAQRLNPYGEPLWNNDGVPLCRARGFQDFPQIISDDSGGAIVIWEDYRSENGYCDLFAQRIDPSGKTLWRDDGVPVCIAADDQRWPQLIPDGSGGAIITWQDWRKVKEIGYDIYAQRLSSSGNALWTFNGIPVCASPQNQRAPLLVSDGSGGAIIVWQDRRSGHQEIYAQRLDSSGNALWAADGVPLCIVPGDKEHLHLTPDGSGGAFLAWQDRRSEADLDIYAQKVDASGKALWTVYGVAVCVASQHQRAPRLISDGSGGVVIIWEDRRGGGGDDIYAQRLNASGKALWALDGVPVCTAIDDQSWPQATSDGSGKALIAWSDYRGDNPPDIYAQLIHPDGSLGSAPPDHSKTP